MSGFGLAQHLADQQAAKDVELATKDAEIERLQAQNAKMKGALAPFGAVAEKDVGDSEHDDDIFRPMTRYNRAPVIKVGDLRRARAALDAKP